MRLQPPALALALLASASLTPALLTGAAQAVSGPAGQQLPAAVLAAAATPSDLAEETDFLFRLGLMEGHLMVGYELLRADRPELALPHFGHPVHELYDDIAGYIATRKLKPFDADLVRLEAAAAGAPKAAQTEAQYQAVIATIERARQTVPESIRASIPAMVGICADTLDAAAGEYGESLSGGKLEGLVEYHDSRGFVNFAALEVDRLQGMRPDASDQGMLARFKTVLARAQAIVAPLFPSSAPPATVAEYRAIAADAHAVAKQR